MGDVDLPGALEDAGARNDEAALAHGAPVDEGRRVARDENEDLSRVAETVVADRHPADDVRRDVVEEDQPERNPAEQVQSQIALCRNRGGHGWSLSLRPGRR